MSNYPDTITGRVLAVLDHDGIPERRRAAHLRDTCGISMYAAKRLAKDIGRIRTETLIKISAGLDVSCAWLLEGWFERYHPRTMRIYIERIKGYSPEDAALMQRLAFGEIAKHPRARNLLALVEAGHLSMKTAAKLYARRQ